MTEDLLDSSRDPASFAALLRTGFHSRSDQTDEAVVVRLHGELDMETAPLLGEQLTKVLECTPAAVVLDVSDLTFVDSTGIRVLVAAFRRGQMQGSPFRLRSPTRSVAKALRLTGTDQMVVIEDPVDTARPGPSPEATADVELDTQAP